jgi:hypothetical protein
MRRTLPERRITVTKSIYWQNHEIIVAAGIHPTEGWLGEIFVDAAHGGQMQTLLRDAVTAISVALQYGVPLAEMGKSLAREPIWTTQGMADGPASPLGAVIDGLIKWEAAGWSME